MKKTKNVLIVLVAIGAMCGVVCGFFISFRKTFTDERSLAESVPAETVYVYYAEQETQEPTRAPLEIIVQAPEPTQSPTTETTAETVRETTPETTVETAVETTAETTAETEAETIPETVPETTKPTPTKRDRVPNYYETDYPEIRFMTGSFSEYGSGVTSVAMVATYLTGYEYTPDQLAKWFSSYIGNQIQILEHISETLRLPWYRAENFHVARQALKDGKVVIALMGSKSIFTTGQHFIVLTGINEDGKILVNDPNRKNYDQWNLKKSFEEGFREGDILAGYSGAWIYEPEQVPEEPYYYEDQTPEEEHRYPDLTLTDEEKDLLAKVIFAEVQEKPFKGQQAFAEVVLNRIMAQNFPNNLHDVLYQPGQFLGVSRLYAAKPTHVQYEAIRRAMEGPYVLDQDQVIFYGGQ